MKKLFEGIKNVFWRELGLISHDKNLITVLLLAPVFYALFYGSVYINKTEQNVPIAVIDADRSALSQKLIRLLDASPIIEVSYIQNNLEEAKGEIYSSSSQAVLFIPKDFETMLKKGKGTDLKLYLNNSRFLISNDINKSVNEVIAAMSAGIKLSYFQAEGYSLGQAKEMIEPLRVDMRNLYNTTESYGDFMIPAIMILILHQTLLIGLSESFAKEREDGTLKDLLTAANNSESSMLIGKGMFYFFLYLGYSLFFFSILFSLFKIKFIGSFLAFAISTIIMLMAVISISIFISSFFDRKIIAMQYLTLSSYPVFLVSGFSWPFESMPPVIQFISSLIPFTPYSTAIVKTTQMGGGLGQIQTQIIHLLILSVFYFGLAYMRMNRILKIHQ